MNFNFSFVLALMASLTLFTGCSEFLKGKPKKEEVLEVQSDEISCFKDISKEFKKLVKAESTDEEINQTFNCLDKTLNQFQNRVRGKENADSFTANELFIIFQKVQKNDKISEQATSDILVLKKALIGGVDNVITKAEIGELRTYLFAFRTEVKKVAPFLKIFAFKKENGPFSRATLDQSFLQLKSSLKTLLNLSKLGKSEYNFEDLKKLLLNLNVLEADQKDLIDLAEKVKNVMVGTDPLKSSKDYELAIDNFVDIMAVFADSIYGDVKFEISSAPQMNSVVNFVEKLIGILESSVQYKAQGKIKLIHFDALLEDIMKRDAEKTHSSQKILPFDASFLTFKTFYKKILTRVFSDKRELSADSVEFLEPIHIKTLKREIAVYKLYLSFLNSLELTGEKRMKLSDIQTRLKAFLPQDQSEILLKLDALEQKIVMQGFIDMKAEVLSEKPVMYRFKKMVIALNQEIWDQTWEDLARGFFGKMLGRELIIGWGKTDANRNMSQSTLFEQNLVDWYTDFKQFAIETKIFDKETDNAGKSSFLEANLLTYSGNGDDKLSFLETVQYVNMLLSGGGQSFTQAREGAAAAKCNLAEKDSFDFPWNDETCFYTTFRANYKNYYSNLSYLVGYLDKLSEVEFKEFYLAIMNDVARRDPKNSGVRIESNDIRRMNMVLVYMESVFSRYDKDKNWNLSSSEIRESYPRFQTFVNDFAMKTAKATLDEWDSTILNPCKLHYNKADLLRESFVYLVFNGVIPTKANLDLVACTFGNGLFPLKGEVTRKTLINTFKVLKSVQESTK